MTREAIQERLAKLSAEKDQAVATVNALIGAMQDCQFWLAQLEASDAVDEKTS